MPCPVQCLFLHCQEQARQLQPAVCCCLVFVSLGSSAVCFAGHLAEERPILNIHMEEPQPTATDGRLQLEERELYQGLRDVEKGAHELGSNVAELIETRRNRMSRLNHQRSRRS